MAAPEDPARARRLTVAAPLPREGFGGAGRLTTVHAALRLVRIGRAPENDIVVEDVLVSRKHAELRGNPASGYELVDLGSHNGTFVNGVRIEKVQLEQLDVVGIGRAQFRLVGDSLEEYVDTGEITFEARSLTARVDGRVLVDGVGISLRERALLGIVGPSGCGKTTLLHALSGRRPATSGTVLYDGLDLYAQYDELRSRIGFVPQDDVLHRELHVEALLEYAAELAFPADVTAAERSQRVDEVLRELALEERRDARVDRLSGGQRKRVSVALALLTKPSLLFLDEPTSGLDPGYERTLMELLRGLADGGRTVIVVTHTVQSLRLCDRTLVLAPGGKPAYFGPPQLAPAYFGRDDLQQVFQDLSAVSEIDWAARFREHPDHVRYGADTDEPVVGEKREAPPAERRGPWLRQFRTLTRRNVELLASDRRNLALLAFQAPVLGLIMLLALPSGQLSVPPDGTLRVAAKGGLVLLTLVMAATWLGASNAVREIVRELPIFRRERALGLSISAYLTSKALVLGGVAVLQALVLVALANARQGGPFDAVALSWPWLELATAVAATSLAATALGLLVSALSSRVELAMTVLPVLIVAEVILGMGGISPEMVSKPVIKQLSYVASTQWGFSAAASTAGLNDLEPLNGLGRTMPTFDLSDPSKAARGFAKAYRGEPRWDHTVTAWGTSMLSLFGLTVVALAGAGLALRRADRRRP
ncbi:MAG: ATP-binding cassette domain-containing protein [Actinomycetota bacterium]